MRWVAAAALLLLAGLVTLPAQRARDLRQIEPRPFGLTHWGGRLGVEAVYRTEDQTSDGGSDFHRELRRFEEYIELTGEGFVYHPLFMDWRGQVRLGLLQQRYETDAGDGENVHDLLQEYDFDAIFFQEKPVRILVNARRRDDVVRDLFSDVIHVEENRGGATVQFVNAIAPAHITVDRQTMHRFGFSQDSDSTLNTAEARMRILPGSRFSTDLSYRHRDYHEDFRARNGFDLERTTDLESHEFNLLNIARFGPRGRHRVTTTGHLYDQTGTTETRTARFTQRADLALTRRLDTYLSGAFDRVEAASQTTSSQRVNAGLHHRLFESLDTFVDVRARRTEFEESGEETDIGGGVRFAYRRTTPHGHLSAGYSIDVDQIDRGQTSGFRSVTDEAIVLADGQLTFLANRDVLLGTVVVTDAAGLRVYVDGLDYRLTEVGGRVQIERLLGGGIAGGETVLVDYDFEQEGDVSFTQLAQSVNVRHDWTEGLLQGLGLYYRYGDLRNSGETGESEPLEFSSHTVGSIYRWRFLEWTEEFQDFDANISPYSSLRSALMAQFQPWRRTQARVGAEHLTVNYRESGEDDTGLINLTAQINGQAGRHTTWNLQALQRFESGRNEETATGLAAFLRWTYRKLSAEIGVRLEMRDRSGSERDNAMVFVAVTREF